MSSLNVLGDSVLDMFSYQNRLVANVNIWVITVFLDKTKMASLFTFYMTHVASGGGLVQFCSVNLYTYSRTSLLRTPSRLGRSDQNSEVTVLVRLCFTVMEIMWDCLRVTIMAMWLCY